MHAIYIYDRVHVVKGCTVSDVKDFVGGCIKLTHTALRAKNVNESNTFLADRICKTAQFFVKSYLDQAGVRLNHHASVVYTSQRTSDVAIEHKIEIVGGESVTVQESV